MQVSDGVVQEQAARNRKGKSHVSVCSVLFWLFGLIGMWMLCCVFLFTGGIIKNGREILLQVRMCLKHLSGVMLCIKSKGLEL